MRLVGSLLVLVPSLMFVGCGNEVAPDPELADEATESTAQALTQGPNPAHIILQSITYGGTGCPQGSIGTSLSADRTSLTLIYDQLVASTGPGVPVTNSRKNCQVNIKLLAPQGWSYSIGTVDYRGNVALPAGVSAEEKLTYYFQGQTAQVNSGARFVGPVDRDYVFRDRPVVTVWSPCAPTSQLNLNGQVRIVGPASANAQMTGESSTGKVMQILGLSWKKC